MKSIFKVLFFLCALSLAFPVFAQSDFEATKARAEAGDAEAQNSLGRMYYYGSGVAENDQEAVRLYRLAADQGLADAQYNLGLMYYSGIGVAENEQEALKWYRLAAEQGNVYAQNNLARHEAPSPPSKEANASNNAARNCTSNAQEVNRQVQNISQAYDARFEDLRSKSLDAGLRGTAAYGLGGYSRGVAESGVGRERDQLELQKSRDIADLRSRIIEICDPVPAPQVTGDDIERGTNIATALQELSALHDSGALTDEEFQAAKRRVLGLD